MFTLEESQSVGIAFQIPDRLLFTDNMFDSIVEALIKFKNASTVYFHINFSRYSLNINKTTLNIINSFKEDLIDKDSPIDREKIAIFNNAKIQVKQDVKEALHLTLNFEIPINRNFETHEEIASDILTKLSLKTKDYINIH